MTNRRELASQSDMHLESLSSDGGTEIKWCIFTKEKRAPIAKIIVDTRLKRAVQDAEPIVHIVNVHVRPEYRGRRLGEHLVRLAQSEMKANGFKWMTLEAEENVEQHGKLVRLYERCGFETVPGKIPLEYNGDECFRKVPMKCDLEALIVDGPFPITPVAPPPVPAASALTTSSSAAMEEVVMPVEANMTSKFATPAFVEELKRECIQLVMNAPLNVDVRTALDWIDSHALPGSMDRALRTGMVLRSKGHPDWMELAGYLRFLGLAQLKWTEWHAPYMVMIENEQPMQEEAMPHQDEEMLPSEERTTAKHGPLPSELNDHVAFVHLLDPERYAQEGIDEALVSWTPSEFAFLALTRQPDNRSSSAPHEMAQCLRYVNCLAWLESNEFAYLEGYGDADLKRLVNEYREGVHAADTSDIDMYDLAEARVRLEELVDKYISDVRVL